MRSSDRQRRVRRSPSRGSHRRWRRAPLDCRNSTWPRYASLASFPAALPMQHRLGVGRRLVRVIAPPFPVEVDRGALPGSSGVVARSAASTHRKLLQALPTLPIASGSTDLKCSSESSPAARAWVWTASKNDWPRSSPASRRSRFFGKRRGMPHGVVHTQAHEPAEQQVVVELFGISSRSLRTVVREHLQATRRRSTLSSGGIDGRICGGVQPANRRDIVCSASSVSARTRVRSGWFAEQCAALATGS